MWACGRVKAEHGSCENYRAFASCKLRNCRAHPSKESERPYSIWSCNKRWRAKTKLIGIKRKCNVRVSVGAKSTRETNCQAARRQKCARIKCRLTCIPCRVRSQLKEVNQKGISWHHGLLEIITRLSNLAHYKSIGCFNTLYFFNKTSTDRVSHRLTACHSKAAA